MGWRPIFTSWLHMLPQTLTEFHRELIKDLFNRFVDACIRTVRKAIEVSDNILKNIRSALCCLYSFVFIRILVSHVDIFKFNLDVILMKVKS